MGQVICPSCRAENDVGAEVCFTCRSVLSAITQGTLVADRYEIIGFLGRGGMGAVYRAQDRLLEEAVALKILRADVAGSPEMARRFRTEIKLARKVSHPSVCRIHEYGEDGSLHFISMELVEGASLKDLLDHEGRLPVDRACEIAAAAADGLQAIHTAGVVHRDLKPPNVMLDKQGRVRLMDFGIARQLAGASSPTTGYVVGSPEYMSPEQGRGRRVDARSDIYALGVVLYELLTGSVPFRGDTPVVTLLMHVEQPPPLDSPAAAHIPEPIRDVLRRTLAKDPGARYASARHMADAIRKASGITGPTPSRPVRSRARSDWRRAALLAALGMGGIAVVLARRSLQPALEPSASPAPALVAAPPTSSLLPPTPSPSTPPQPTARVRRSPGVDRAPAASTTSNTPPPSTTPPPPESPAAPPSPSPEPSKQTEAPKPAPSLVAEERTGMLLIAVSPWADVQVDGVHVGQTPLRPLVLAPGPHALLLTHPDFHPYPRRVTIRPSETLRLVIDLRSDGVRKRPR